MSTGNGATFRFGDGPGLPSLGKCTVDIILSPDVTNQSTNQMLKLEVHVVGPNVPLLVSRKSLSHTGASLGFRKSTLTLNDEIAIQLHLDILCCLDHGGRGGNHLAQMRSAGPFMLPR